MLDHLGCLVLRLRDRRSPRLLSFRQELARVPLLAGQPLHNAAYLLLARIYQLQFAFDFPQISIPEGFWYYQTKAL